MDEENKDAQEVTDSLQSMNILTDTKDSDEHSKETEKQKGVHI